MAQHRKVDSAMAQYRGVPARYALPPQYVAPQYGAAGPRVIGVRGAPTGPRVDLSRADTGEAAHDLYVKVVGPDDPDKKSRLLTLEVLKYVHSRLAEFKQMGIAIKVHRITAKHLQSPQLIGAMKKRGIARLPALTTANNVYLGFKEISDLYERNIRELAARDRRGERAAEGATDEDPYDEFFAKEMNFERAEEDAQETGLNADAENMMDSYRHMIERREKSDSKHRPRQPGRSREDEDAGDAEAPRRAPQSRPRTAAAGFTDSAPRRDNVARKMDAEDEEINDTINRLSQDIDDNLHKKAFSEADGDSGEGGDSVQDELMERAFYSNHASSDNL
jgi:hypothetical protein